MKTNIILAFLFAALTSLAEPTPGFVYRARISTTRSSQSIQTNTTYDVSLKLYAAKVGGEALWSGSTKIATGEDGLFQIWVSDEIATKGSAKLTNILERAEAAYLGVAFDGGAEQTPRRAILPVPRVDAAGMAIALADPGTIAELKVGEVSVTGEADISNATIDEIVGVADENGTKPRLNITSVSTSNVDASIKIIEGKDVQLISHSKPIKVNIFAVGGTKTNELVSGRMHYIYEADTGNKIKRSGFIVLMSDTITLPCATLPVIVDNKRQNSYVSWSSLAQTISPVRAMFYPFGE